MNILFSSRHDVFRQSGGDTLHMLTYAHALESLGVKVFLPGQIPDQKPDLIHHFNIGRPESALAHLRRFPGKPLLISSVYVDYSLADSQNRSVLRHLSGWLLNKQKREYWKAYYRFLRRQREKLDPQYRKLGHAKSVNCLLKRADAVLTASHSEAGRLAADFPDVFFRSHILPPALSSIFNVTENHSKNDDWILCAARFEPLKNQLRLIKAVKGTTFKLFLAGIAAPNHKAYLARCKQAADNNVVFLGSLSQSELLYYYQKCAIHALPSFFETTGLSTLEALSQGCKAVVGAGSDVRDIFVDRVHYADPRNENSIRKALIAASKDGRNHQQWVHTHFDPNRLAERLVEIYKSTLAP